MTAECVRCGRPTADGYACSACTNRAVDQLAEIANLAVYARLVAYGQVRLAQGGSSGKPGSRSPGNDDAMDALDAIQNALSTIARDIAETRGAEIAVDASTHPDPLGRTCSWLGGQMEWARHAVDDQGGPYAGPILAEVADCAAQIRRIVDGPRAKKYLGPCGAEQVIEASGYTITNHDQLCEGDVYGPAGGSKGTCRTCGAQVAQDERRAWLDEQVADHLADTPIRARDIAHALRLSANTIRTWSHTVYADNGEVRRAAKLSSYWRNESGQIVPWVEPAEGEDVKARGPRLHYVDEVQELARKAADRRAEAEARRDRRDTQDVAA